jgi:ABC-type spermidine/putrescine transport system permease subunit I
VNQPVEWLLFSDFSVVLAFVHLYTMFMIVPIFNSMMRIDRRLLEAARRRRLALADAVARACRCRAPAC